MTQRTVILIGSILGALSVMTGAFGAHGLKSVLDQTGRAETFELAVRYQFYHTFAILLAGALIGTFKSSLLQYAVLFFILGIVFFCGSLYILSLTGKTWLGAVTPIGGLLFILGWGTLAVGVTRRQSIT